MHRFAKWSLVGLVACTDPSIPAPPSDAADSADTSSATTEPACDAVDDDMATAAAPEAPSGPTTTRRLTRREYIRSLMSAMPPSAAAAVEAELWRLPPDVSTDGFDTMDSRTSGEHVEAWQRVALVASRAFSEAYAPIWATSGTCGVDSAQCVAAIVEQLGPSTLRRPLTPDELATAESDFMLARDGANDIALGIEAVALGLLTHPSFLYRFELDVDPADGEQSVPLSDVELAGRLAFAFTGGPPSADLLATANMGFSGTEQILDLARGLYDTADAREVVWQFFSGWLGLDRMPQLQFPDEFYPMDRVKALRNIVLQEMRELVTFYAFESPGAGYTELMTTRHANEVIASQFGLYGETEVVPPNTAIELDAATRSGILTRSAILVQLGEYTSPMRRGAFVRRRLLCEDVPSPSPTIIDPVKAVPPSQDENRTTRQRWTEATQSASCAPCHDQFNGFGFAMEKYDSLGRYRETERTSSVLSPSAKNLPIDDTVTMTIDGQPVTFTGVNGIIGAHGRMGLGGVLAESPSARRCMARQWFRFVMGRRETAIDAGSIDAVTAALDQGGLAEMFVAIATTPAFRERKVHPMESAP